MPRTSSGCTKLATGGGRIQNTAPQELTDQVTRPAGYGLTNVTAAACPVTGMDSSGLPSYNFLTCTSAALNAAPPAGLAPGWWQSWTFSDGFHPTPYGHHLLAASTLRAIAQAGWL